MFQKNIDFKPLVFVLILVINNCFFISIQAIYYIIVVLFWMLYFFQEILSNELKYSSLFLFYFACLFSIWVNDIPSQVQPYFRFGIFFMMTTLLGPAFYSAKLNEFKNKVFIYLNNINLFICSLSIVLNITGLHQGQVMNLQYNVLRPDFAGLYNHSMTLGPMSAIGVLYCFYLLKIEKINKYVIYLIMLLCFLACLKSGSRTGLAGLVISVIYIYYKLSGEKSTKLMLFVFSTTLLLLVLYPFYSSYIEFMMQKFDNNAEAGSVISSRESKWSARIQEFLSSPFFGVGYGNVRYEAIGEEGIVEPGSSWLAILSMTGLLGFCLFFINYYKIFISKMFLKRKSDYFSFAIAVTLLLSIYMIFEGTFLSAGTLMSAMIWVNLGIINSRIK